MNSISSEAVSELSTIRDFIRWASSQFVKSGVFFGHGTANARDEAAALVLRALYQPYDLPIEYFSAVLTHTERLRITDLVEARITERKPLAYLTNEAVFAGMFFYVDERVLVPRSPIAELIEQQFMPWIDPEQVGTILDLCTGSACIACACAMAFPDALVDAVDLSTAALAVAAINIDKHRLSDRLTAIESDLYTQIDKKYDLIVSNPPYVSREELRQLPAEYHAEPSLGFDGGLNGLDIVIRILAEVSEYMNEGGILVLEVGSSAETLQNTFPEVPFYWLEFERGGEGVFLLTVEQVREFSDLFKKALN